MSKQILRNIALCCLSVTLFTVFAVRVITANAAENGFMDEKAIEVLKNMSDYLDKAETLNVEAITLYDHIMKTGIAIKNAKDTEVFLKRPDKLFAIARTDDQKQRKIYFNGKDLIRLMVNENTYQKIAFSGDTGQMLDYIIDNYDVAIPLVDFLYNDIAGTFREYIISAEYMGERIVDNVPCHHLSFESTGADWQLWVQVGERPIPRRFAITYVNIKEQPQFLAIFKNWRINPELDEKIFSFTPPIGVKEVEIKKAPGSTQVE